MPKGKRDTFAEKGLFERASDFECAVSGGKGGGRLAGLFEGGVGQARGRCLGGSGRGRGGRKQNERGKVQSLSCNHNRVLRNVRGESPHSVSRPRAAVAFGPRKRPSGRSAAGSGGHGLGLGRQVRGALAFLDPLRADPLETSSLKATSALPRTGNPLSQRLLPPETLTRFLGRLGEQRRQDQPTHIQKLDGGPYHLPPQRLNLSPPLLSSNTLLVALFNMLFPCRKRIPVFCLSKNQRNENPYRKNQGLALSVPIRMHPPEC